MKIGNIELESNVMLGPMAGVTDMPYRMICREMGCGLLYSEMVSAKAILYKNKNTKALLQFDKSEHPIAIQLFGSDPDIMADMAKKVYDETGCDIIDINMGCPVPKIVNNHEGSFLMTDEVLAGRIIEKMANAVEIPITVKFRKGFDKEHVNAVSFAKMAENSGAKMIAVHGRTREEYYAGEADWDIIRQVKESVHIPVVGSGDVRNAIDAKRMIDECKVDGVMIARAARGNPWIFREVNAYLKDGTIIERPELPEVCEMILRHAKMEVEFKGEYTGIREMRKHVAWYTQGLRNACVLRRTVNKVETYKELEVLINRGINEL